MILIKILIVIFTGNLSFSSDSVPYLLTESVGRHTTTFPTVRHCLLLADRARLRVSPFPQARGGVGEGGQTLAAEDVLAGEGDRVLRVDVTLTTDEHLKCELGHVECPCPTSPTSGPSPPGQSPMVLDSCQTWLHGATRG